jgi:hypothetical protein
MLLFYSMLIKSVVNKKTCQLFDRFFYVDITGLKSFNSNYLKLFEENKCQ